MQSRGRNARRGFHRLLVVVSLTAALVAGYASWLESSPAAWALEDAEAKLAEVEADLARFRERGASADLIGGFQGAVAKRQRDVERLTVESERARWSFLLPAAMAGAIVYAGAIAVFLILRWIYRGFVAS